MAKELICWDSSVLIDFLKGDDAPTDRIKPIRNMLEYAENRSCLLVFSTLIYPEVLASAMPDGAIEEFERFMKNREKSIIIAVDIAVAKKAQKIRDRTGLKTPDAVHIATALISNAKLFHTFDKDMLNLNGQPEVDSLSITKCHIPGLTHSLF